MLQIIYITSNFNWLKNIVKKTTTIFKHFTQLKRKYIKKKKNKKIKNKKIYKK